MATFSFLLAMFLFHPQPVTTAHPKATVESQTPPIEVGDGPAIYSEDCKPVKPRFPR